MNLGINIYGTGVVLLLKIKGEVIVNKQLIKDTIKEMVHDGELRIVWDFLPPSNYIDSVEHKGDIEDTINWMEIRLEVDDE